MPDISLYDHLRTTAAIAVCLYRSYEARNAWGKASLATQPGEPFCLVVGDVSGIQVGSAGPGLKGYPTEIGILEIAGSSA